MRRLETFASAMAAEFENQIVLNGQRIFSLRIAGRIDVNETAPFKRTPWWKNVPRFSICPAIRFQDNVHPSLSLRAFIAEAIPL